jgi:hypothetical protein
MFDLHGQSRTSNTQLFISRLEQYLFFYTGGVEHHTQGDFAKDCTDIYFFTLAELSGIHLVILQTAGMVLGVLR